MRRRNIYFEWLMTYGWAILIVLIITGTLAFLSTKEEFNPELHNCTKRADCPELTYIYGLYAVSEDGGTCLYKTTNGIAYYLPEEGEIPDVEIHTKCVSWQPKQQRIKVPPTAIVEVVEEHSQLRNFTEAAEAELHCLFSPEDEDKCVCKEFSDNLIVHVNETRLILPEGITSPPSGFAGGICGHGGGFNTSCTAWNFTKKKGCFIAVPRELSFKEKCLSREWNYAIISKIISNTSFGAIETCSFFNTTPEFTAYLYNSTNVASQEYCDTSFTITQSELYKPMVIETLTNYSVTSVIAEIANPNFEKSNYTSQKIYDLGSGSLMWRTEYYPSVIGKYCVNFYEVMPKVECKMVGSNESTYECYSPICPKCMSELKHVIQSYTRTLIYNGSKIRFDQENCRFINNFNPIKEVCEVG